MRFEIEVELLARRWVRRLRARRQTRSQTCSCDARPLPQHAHNRRISCAAVSRARRNAHGARAGFVTVTRVVARAAMRTAAAALDSGMRPRVLLINHARAFAEQSVPARLEPHDRRVQQLVHRIRKTRAQHDACKHAALPLFLEEFELGLAREELKKATRVHAVVQMATISEDLLHARVCRDGDLVRPMCRMRRARESGSCSVHALPLLGGGG